MDRYVYLPISQHFCQSLCFTYSFPMYISNFGFPVWNDFPPKCPKLNYLWSGKKIYRAAIHFEFISCSLRMYESESIWNGWKFYVIPNTNNRAASSYFERIVVVDVVDFGWIVAKNLFSMAFSKRFCFISISKQTECAQSSMSCRE